MRKSPEVKMYGAPRSPCYLVWWECEWRVGSGRAGSEEGCIEDSRSQIPEGRPETMLNGLGLDPEKVWNSLKKSLSERDIVISVSRDVTLATVIRKDWTAARRDQRLLQ